MLLLKQRTTVNGIDKLFEISRKQSAEKTQKTVEKLTNHSKRLKAAPKPE